ncbi:MAG TPA: RNA polymerase sigma factor [Thermoanaerobaculia bacterium]|nr:RNA polymerase sigma factor [Thermoanaerobaculia bacterium]HUM29634.1 RNA polymerase sigma factor [Thermoanaerobaculia bacterium]HXK67285.1 RNA polymerase sigma factor [Thermoanaerobaculia bacterium]
MNDTRLRQFFLDHYLPACRYAAGLVGPDDAEDVVQDALVRIYNRPAILEDPRPLKAYFFKTLTTVCYNRLRRRRFTARLNRLIRLKTEEKEHPTGGVEEVWSMLSPGERSVSIFETMMHFSAEETSKILGIAPTTIRVMLHRVRSKIREWEAKT